MKGALGMGRLSLSKETQCGGPQGRTPLLGSSGMGISLHGGSVGQPGVGLSTGDFERWLKVALEVGCLSMGAL